MEVFGKSWQDLQTVSSASFVCGYCNSAISSDKAYTAHPPSYSTRNPHIYICHVCNKPTFVWGEKTTPAAALGNPVDKLPADIEAIYSEIRYSTSVNSYTAAVLAARKLLMHIAVEKGAEAGKKFVTYVNYLESNHYTPPNSTSWVDKIRQLGNEANHEIVIMTKDDALLIIKFLEMLMKFIYEFPDEPVPEEVETAEPDAV